jgi:uncharacterized protein YdhG (YjbR/CyaY superfamily)
MVQSKAKTVKEYLEQLPDERRKAIAAVRKVVRKNLPRGYAETMNWGMICYEIPLGRYPDTYNKQPLMYAALASQKNHMAVYLTSVYADKATEKWFVSEYKKAGKKLDMGKSCVRFKQLDDLPLELIGETIARTSVEDYIAFYERSRRK